MITEQREGPIRFWRLKEPLLTLAGCICPHCQEKMFPPREVCLNCNKSVVSQVQPEETPKQLQHEKV